MGKRVCVSIEQEDSGAGTLSARIVHRVTNIPRSTLFLATYIPLTFIAVVAIALTAPGRTHDPALTLGPGSITLFLIVVPISILVIVVPLRLRGFLRTRVGSVVEQSITSGVAGPKDMPFVTVGGTRVLAEDAGAVVLMKRHTRAATSFDLSIVTEEGEVAVVEGFHRWDEVHDLGEAIAEVLAKKLDEGSVSTHYSTHHEEVRD